MSQPDDLEPLDLGELGGRLTKQPAITYGRSQSMQPLTNPSQNLFSAIFFRDTTIGAILSSREQGTFDPNVHDEFDFLKLVPERYIDRFDAYARATTPQEAREVTQQLDDEYQALNTIAASPYKSFFYSFGAQAIDPINWIPGTVIFGNATRLSRVAKAAFNAGSTALVTTALQEAIIQPYQLTRELDESIFNILAAGTLASVLGGAGAAFGPGAAKYSAKARDFARDELINLYTDTAKKLSPNGTLDANSIAKMPKPVQFFMKNSLMNRMLTSDLDTPKAVAAELFEHNYTLEKNVDGTANKFAELNIKLDLAKGATTLIDYDDIFFAQAGVKRGFMAYRNAAKRASSDPAGIILNKNSFDSAVGFRMFSDIPHANEAVNKAADLLNERIVKPTLDALVAQGHLPEGVTPKNAKKYFSVVWNKQKIKEYEVDFMDMASTWFKRISDVTRQVRDNLEYKTLDAEVTSLKKDLKKAKALGQKDKAHSIKDQLTLKQKKLEDFTRSVAGLSLEPDELEAIFHTKGAKKGQLRKPLSDTEIKANVRATVDRITGNDTSKIRDGIVAQLDKKTRSMRDRTFLIPQRVAWEWQIQSAPDVMASYLRAVTPVIRMTEMAREKGFDTIKEWHDGRINQLKTEFEMRKKGASGKDAAKFDKQFNAQRENITNSFKMLLGIYGDGPNIHDNSAAKFYRTLMDWNYIRLLGFMTLSAIPELGLHVFTHGPFSFMYDGLRATLKQSLGVIDSFTKNDLNALGYAMETAMGTRLKSLAAHDGLTTQPTFMSKLMDRMVNTFGNVSLINQWNDIQQTIAGTMGINRTLHAIEKYMTTGKLAKSERTRLAQIGIDEKHFPVIYEMWKKHGGADGGTYFANWTQWEVDSPLHAAALLDFQRSVAHEIDSIVIKPGLGDKPSFAQTGLGRLLTQFKSYQFAATNKILFSGLQRLDDINMYYGIVSMLSLGALSYVAREAAKGNRNIDLSFERLADESINRSALLGIVSEAYNIANKAGFGATTSRYDSRGLWGMLLGPSVGLTDEFLGVFNRVRTMDNDKPLTTKDLEKLLRLAPYQNLFYTYYLSRKVLGKAAESSGIAPPQSEKYRELFQ